MIEKNQQIIIRPNIIRTLIASIIVFITNIFSISILIIITIYFKKFIQELFQIELIYNIILYTLIAILILSILIGLTKLSLKVFSLKSIKYIFKKESISKEKTQINEEYISLPINQITDISLRVGIFLDYIFKTGTISIQTAGTSGTDLKIENIKSSNENFNIIEKTISNNKSEKELLKVKPDITIATIMTILKTIGLLIGISFFILTSLIPLTYLLYQYTQSLVIPLIIIVFLLVIGLFFGYISLIVKQYKRIQYIFYQDSLRFSDGFLIKRKTYLQLKRITNSNCDQSLLDRIIGTYTITLDTAGSSSTAIKIMYVKDGDKINSHIQEILKQRGEN